MSRAERPTIVVLHYIISSAGRSIQIPQEQLICSIRYVLVEIAIKDVGKEEKSLLRKQK